MDVDRLRIQEDLRGRIAGDVYGDPVHIQLCSVDASIYSIVPLAVVRPRGLSDVVACVQYAAENQIPVHPRGAATGLTGGCLGPGLVIDFSRYMRRTLEITGDQARVQPGAVLSQLNRQLATRGRKFGPDPATLDISTLGGTLAVNGSGSHWPRFGAARDCVEQLQVVLADGSVVEFRRPGVAGSTSEPADRTTRAEDLSAQVARLIGRHAPLIEVTRPLTLVNSSGYELSGLITEGAVDLTRLMVGSEGTLGLITEATIRTHPCPAHVGVVLLFFDRMEKAARAALELRGLGVAACDLLDRRLLRLARESDVRYDVLIPDEAEAMLLVEQDGDSMADVRDRLRHVANLMCRRKKTAFDARMALNVSDVHLYWQLALHVVPTLYRISETIRPVPFVEDIAVPPDSLPTFLVTAQNVLKRHQITASLFAHANHGQIHLRPFLDLDSTDDVARLHHVARDLYREVADVRGTISGEHGDGLSRSWYLREQSPAYYKVLQEVKQIFDPDRLFNPGKVADEVPASPTAHIRRTRPQLVEQGVLRQDETQPPGTLESSVGLEFSWSHQELFQIVSSCNGCGRCRTTDQDQRMCPIFRILPAEEASPRAKATLLRGLFEGTIDGATLAGDELRSVSDLCVNCQQCRNECPAGVDIPRLVLECKAQNAAVNGLGFTEWWLGNLDLLASRLAPFRTLVNLALRNRRCRWLLERTFGLARWRKLPRFEAVSFQHRAARRQLTKHTRSSGLKVVYFTDIYANWFDVQLADAAVAVLHHNGVSVFVPPRQVQCGMALLASGAVDQAKRMAEQNIRVLSDAIRQGYHVVASEPSAVLCLTQEYPRLIPGDDTTLVAEHTSELCTFLWQLHQQGRLELDFSPLSLNVGYHLPCHLRALQKGPAGEYLLKLIPGITVRSLERGCSGMAGAWGLKASNFRNSLRAGWPLIQELRKSDLDVGATECAACKMQMEQATSRPTIHPIKLLALAYRLMPEIETLVESRGGDLVIT